MSDEVCQMVHSLVSARVVNSLHSCIDTNARYTIARNALFHTISDRAMSALEWEFSNV